MKKVNLYAIAVSMMMFSNYACNTEDFNAKEEVQSTEEFQSTEKSDEKEELQPVNELYEKMERAFQLSSTNDLEQFFKDWNESVFPNTVEFIQQNDTVEAIYEVYKLFYEPLDLTKLGNWEELSKNLNSNCKYVAVQNKIIYGVVEDIISSELPSYYYSLHSAYDTINDFRPSINMAKEQVLYLLPEYEEALNIFMRTESIGKESTEYNWGNYEDILKRYEFIRPYIPILRGHWGLYWHLATHPQIHQIVFNKPLNKAIIYFRVGYQGGEVILKKQANQWTIIESRVTWIE